jgi:hypothetical protein
MSDCVHCAYPNYITPHEGKRSLLTKQISLGLYSSEIGMKAEPRNQLSTVKYI